MSARRSSRVCSIPPSGTEDSRHRPIGEAANPARRERRDESKNRQRGFAVTEALVALAILGTALAIVYQTMASGWGAVRRTGLDAEAVATAMARMESVGRELPLTEGSTEGRDDAFSWRIDVTRHVLPGLLAVQPQVPAWQVKVEVTWQEIAGEQPRRLSFTTIRSPVAPR